jgi:hypothetical protein
LLTSHGQAEVISKGSDFHHYFRLGDYWQVDERGKALLRLLNGLNIASDLIQVRKVVTGQQSQHDA